ncbi:MAG: hypothetical protein ACFE7R_02810 [Candidatus Hodarchaeota archaeon]
MKTQNEFYNEVQRVLCPQLKRMGRNSDAFRDVLRGGFGAFEEGEEIRVRFLHQNYAKKHLPERFPRIVVGKFEASTNVEFLK